MLILVLAALVILAFWALCQHLPPADWFPRSLPDYYVI